MVESNQNSKLPMKTQVRSSFEALIHKGEVLNSPRCVHYAKLGLAVWAQGRDIDAYRYLGQARYELELTIDELPF